MSDRTDRKGSRSRKRPACIFETTRTWYIDIAGQVRKITAHWKGLLCGTLVILVDGEVAYEEARKHDNAMDPYGSFRIDGQNLAVFPTSGEWSSDQSMDLTVNGRPVHGAGLDKDYEVTEEARRVASQLPENDVAPERKRQKRSRST
jgi:hypothetical protein